VLAEWEEDHRDDGSLYPLVELPATFVYRIDDAETGAPVRPPTAVAWASIPHPLPITAEDNRILDPAKRREVRLVTIIVADVAAAEFVYQVRNLRHV